MSIIIVGGGMTGATLALAVSRMTHGQLRVHLVETIAPEVSTKSDRAIALAERTCQELSRIGIWHVLEDFATKIVTVHVSERGHFGFVTLEAEDYCLNALGQVIKLYDAEVSLFQLLKKTSGVILHCPAMVTNLSRTEDSVSVKLDNGERLVAQLLVAADGSRSPIGTACGITWQQQSYGQVAAIANVLTSVSHEGRAFECFTEHGPLAMLPILQGRSSLVWCHPLKEMDKVLSWSDDCFCEELQRAFGWRLGRILHAEKRSAYPLILTTASRFIAHRTVLVGNASQTLHPVAGQGFNLALRDVISLAETLVQAWAEKEEYGAWPVLWNYQMRRQADKEATIALTDGLVQLFTNRWMPLVIGRNAGMIVMELFVPVRNWLAKRTLGWVAR